MTLAPSPSRRLVLTGLGGMGALGLSGCVTGPGAEAEAATASASRPRPGWVRPSLVPLRMQADRIIRITVCTRPFRAQGPRLDVERIGDKRVVHNYGHGGSGWSLAWGSSAIAAGKALEGGVREAAVIGCGALGLTSALLMQRAGARVTIYAKERAPQTRSARATGVWSPDSRIALDSRAASGFAGLWETMARTSFAMHQTYVGQAGAPVFWQDQYILRDEPQDARSSSMGETLDFVRYGGRLRDITPRSQPLEADQHPFSVSEARLATNLTFNVAELSRRLMADFISEGGRIVDAIFHTPADLARLDEPVVVNCTGYGARDLFQDSSITPVRGQIAWLPPQPEVDYALYYRGVSVVPRPDGVVVQRLGDDMSGYGVENETPDRAEAETAIATIAPLFATA